MFNEDITNELLKMELESKIDRYIFKEYGFSEDDELQIKKSVGECAYLIEDVKAVDLFKLDRYIDRILDASCCLKRTRTSKDALGSDGLIEFVSKDLRMNPEIIVKKIQENPHIMEKVLKKYKEMILHNAMLYYLGYNTKNGIKAQRGSVANISAFLTGRFGEKVEYKKWLSDSFNAIHEQVFKRVPYLIYEDGEVHKYDN